MDKEREGKDAFVSFSVIQFVDREIEKERMLTVAERERLREVLFEKFVAMDKALVLAQSELHRRLDILNHAHEDMAKDRGQFLTIDVHDRFYAEYKTWKDEMNAAVSNMQGRAAATVVILGFLFMLMQVLIRIFWK